MATIDKYGGLIICLVLNLSSQFAITNEVVAQTLKANNEGLIIYNKPTFKRFAILMQDTSSNYANRFSNDWYYPELILRINSQNRLLPAKIIDSSLFFATERRLLLRDSLVSFTGISKHKNICHQLRNYIRLYIGFLDKNDSTIVVVQFLKPREYKRDE